MIHRFYKHEISCVAVFYFPECLSSFIAFNKFFYWQYTKQKKDYWWRKWDPEEIKTSERFSDLSPEEISFRDQTLITNLTNEDKLYLTSMYVAKITNCSRVSFSDESASLVSNL